jgi:predicted nucleotidyltransferase component of viral defense system
MNLHEDQDAFSELIQLTAEYIKLPQIYVEKDYWVTYALRNIAISPFNYLVVFRGGTSLSKAYKLIDRFSEDIDLAINANEVTPGFNSDSQRKKLIKEIESVAASGLRYIENDMRESKGSNFRRTVYEYPKVVDQYDFGQASPQILLEINAFTKPSPINNLLLQAMIADFLQHSGKMAIASQFNLSSFSINVLSVERTLIEKILGAIKDSYSENPIDRLTNRIRHLYDICLILKQERYRDFLGTEKSYDLLRACINDEIKYFPDTKDYFFYSLKEAPLFSQIAEWKIALEPIYKTQFAELVYGKMPSMNEVVSTIDLIKNKLADFNEI